MGCTDFPILLRLNYCTPKIISTSSSSQLSLYCTQTQYTCGNFHGNSLTCFLLIYIHTHLVSGCRSYTWTLNLHRNRNSQSSAHWVKDGCKSKPALISRKHMLAKLPFLTYSWTGPLISSKPVVYPIASWYPYSSGGRISHLVSLRQLYQSSDHK